MDRLDEMFERQLHFQQRLADKKGRPFPPTDPDELMAAITISAYALEDEIHEATDEVGWKPWASSKHVNRAAYLGELVDAWHFFMNLCLLANITPDELYANYMDKIDTNHKRQDDGYDGVTGKCPQCKRAYDDKAVTCTSDGLWCEVFGAEAVTRMLESRDSIYVVPRREANESIEAWAKRCGKIVVTSDEKSTSTDGTVTQTVTWVE